MAQSDGSGIANEKRLLLLTLQGELRKRYPHALPDGVLLFECGHCGAVLPLNHFSAKPDRKYGVRPHCRACRRTMRSTTRFDPSPDLTSKVCRGCLRRHPIGEFYIDRTQPDGYSMSCRAFANARKAGAMAVRHHATVERARREQTIRVCAEVGIDVPDHDIKRCSRCGAVKPLEEFGSDWHKTDRKRHECLDCRT